jgi:uncharacterized protein (TIRG00374 family)
MSKILNSKYLWSILGLLISGLTLYLALQRVSLWEVTREIRQANTLWVLLAVISVLANTLLKGLRWYRLTAEVGRKAGYKRVISANVAGQLLNLIYPARAGDVSRVLIVGQDGREKAYTVGSVVLEKLIDLVAYVLLAVVLLILLPFPDWLGRSVTVASAVAVAGIVFVGWWVSDAQRGERLGRWLESRKVIWLPTKVWQQFIELVQMGLSALEHVRHRKRALELVFWTTLVWLTALLNNILILYALGMNDGLTGDVVPAALLLLIGLMAGIAVPSVPGRIGIFEYICVMALAVFGIGKTQALTYGITLHAVVLLPALVLGAAALLWLSWRIPRPSSSIE